MVRIGDYLKELGEEVFLNNKQYLDYSDVSKEIRNNDPRTILFTEPFKGRDPLVSNLYSTLGKIERLMHTNKGRLFSKMVEAKQHLVKPVVRNRGWQDEFSDASSISRMPLLKYYSEDAGNYVTSSIVVAKDPEDGVVNMSVHRLLHLGANRFSIRIVEERHLHQIFMKHKALDRNMRVAVLIGTPAHIILSASTQLPKEVSELDYAGALNGKPLEVIYSEGLDLPIPLESEYVFEGTIRRDLIAREWMTDILHLPDKPRDQPVLEVERIYLKDNPVYHAILPGGLEHKVLMGYPVEVKIREKLVEHGFNVKDLWLSSGSGGWMHCFISIAKKNDEDPYSVIRLVMETHKSVKGIIVVDDDIDARNYEDVDFALATRFQDKRKFYFFERMHGSSLDPSSDQEKLLTSKWGLDLTLPAGVDRGRFLKSKM